MTIAERMIGGPMKTLTMIWIAIQDFFTSQWAVGLETGEGLYTVRDSNFRTHTLAAIAVDELNELVLNRPCHFAIIYGVDTREQSRMYQPIASK
jgi:hypothetical protein